VQCCACCSSIAVADCKINLSEVSAVENCKVCALLLRAVKRHCNDDELKAQVVRAQSTLKIGSGGPRILQLCSDSDYSSGPDGNVPISFQDLLEAESPVRFALLHAWLRWCDKSHNCNKRVTKSEAALPTRLLYVGDPNPDVLCLYRPTKKDRMKYVALSHCWGLKPGEKPGFCTTEDNIEARLEGFSFSKLPKTFQDAVRVTRELGIQYLWIDSICIIQWNQEDWEHEAKCMEGVFASAYCTIAATSAVDSKEGFLKRNVSSEYVYVQDASGRRFYVCSNIDDFDNDVENAQLNARAWVMQERVLSRRTIHFSSNQTYFECGEGIYCENFTRLESSLRKKFFLLDPNFPDRLLELGDQRITEFIHFLSESYSKRGLTVETDRCVAISGLEARIADTLGCESRYGIFQRYLHRNLLWQPSDKKMKRIEYKSQNVPSWSWMAYNGGIQFMDIPSGKVDWIDNLRLNQKCESALITDVGKFRNCTMKPDGDHYAVLNLFRRKRGWIRYNVEDRKKLRKEQCVVVGRTAKTSVEEYYILVVVPTGVDGEYRRVGVGMIHSGCVVKRRSNVRVI